MYDTLLVFLIIHNNNNNKKNDIIHSYHREAERVFWTHEKHIDLD